MSFISCTLKDMSRAPEEIEDVENYLKPYVWVSENGTYKITVYFTQKKGHQVVDEVIGEEVDVTPSLEELYPHDNDY